MWGDVGRCGEMCRHPVAAAGEIWGDVGRCGEMWGDMSASGRSSSPPPSLSFRRDMAEVQPRCSRGVAEVQPRRSRSTAEAQPRRSRGAAELPQTSPESLPPAFHERSSNVPRTFLDVGRRFGPARASCCSVSSSRRSSRRRRLFPRLPYPHGTRTNPLPPRHPNPRRLSWRSQPRSSTRCSGSPRRALCATAAAEAATGRTARRPLRDWRWRRGAWARTFSEASRRRGAGAERRGGAVLVRGEI